MTRKTNLFEYVVRVYPIETTKEGGGGVQRQGGWAVFFPLAYITHWGLSA